MADCDKTLQEQIALAVAGKLRTGRVDLLDFDLGVARTIGAVRQDDAFWIINDRLVKPDKFPGIPVIFEVSDDLYREYTLPCIIIRRTGITPALQRWHPGTLQYRAPAKDAAAVTLSNGRQGYDAYEELQQAVPVDLDYSVVLQARNRGGNKGGPISDAQAILAYLYQSLQPRCVIYVEDSEGGLLRSYQGFVDSYQPTQQGSETLSRVIGFEIQLRVEAELDMNAPDVHPAVTRLPTTRFGRY